MNFREDGFWLTGQWAFTPDTWGVVGFTRPADCENFFKNTNDKTIVAIYLTKQNPIDKARRGQVVGFVKLSREKGCSKKFVCKKLWKKNQDNCKTKERWFYGIQITHAWELVKDSCGKVDDIFENTYDPAWGMKIATQGEEVKESDFVNFEKLRCREVNVFKQPSLVGESEITTVGNLLTSSNR